MGEPEILIDLPPEYCEYRDRGCDLYPTCLGCPLPRCRYDEPGGRRGVTKDRRDIEVRRQRSLEGRSIAELAGAFGLSKRTIQRILRRSSSD